MADMRDQPITPESMISVYLEESGVVDLNTPGRFWYRGDHTVSAMYGPEYWVPLTECHTMREFMRRHHKALVPKMIGRHLFQFADTLLGQFTPYGSDPHNEPPYGKQWKTR